MLSYKKLFNDCNHGSFVYSKLDWKCVKCGKGNMFNHILNTFYDGDLDLYNKVTEEFYKNYPEHIRELYCIGREYENHISQRFNSL
jgi:hypothetical protein